MKNVIFKVFVITVVLMVSLTVLVERLTVTNVYVECKSKGYFVVDSKRVISCSDMVEYY